MERSFTDWHGIYRFNMPGGGDQLHETGERRLRWQVWRADFGRTNNGERITNVLAVEGSGHERTGGRIQKNPFAGGSEFIALVGLLALGGNGSPAGFMPIGAGSAAIRSQNGAVGRALPRPTRTGGGVPRPGEVGFFAIFVASQTVACVSEERRTKTHPRFASANDGGNTGVVTDHRSGCSVFQFHEQRLFQSRQWVNVGGGRRESGAPIVCKGRRRRASNIHWCQGGRGNFDYIRDKPRSIPHQWLVPRFRPNKTWPATSQQLSWNQGGGTLRLYVNKRAGSLGNAENRIAGYSDPISLGSRKIHEHSGY